MSDQRDFCIVCGSGPGVECDDTCKLVRAESRIERLEAARAEAERELTEWRNGLHSTTKSNPSLEVGNASTTVYEEVTSLSLSDHGPSPEPQ